jgi:hypothetical protein
MNEYDVPNDEPSVPPALEPEQEAALQALLAPPDLPQDDWDRMHRAIVMRRARAPRRPRNGQCRYFGRPPQPRAGAHALRWLRPAVPLAAAAALLLVFVQREDTIPFDFTEEALLAEMSDSEFHRLISGSAEAASLLLLAVQDENGERTTDEQRDQASASDPAAAASRVTTRSSTLSCAACSAFGRSGASSSAMSASTSRS